MVDLEKAYKRLLNKMYFVELLGEALYNELAAKEKDDALRRIYLRLADNERRSGKKIEKYLMPGRLSLTQKTALNVAAFVFKVFPGRPLAYFLCIAGGLRGITISIPACGKP